MLNDRDKDYETHDDTEYQFTDDEVSYEVETEASKPVINEPKEGFVNRLTRSKRMLISMAVFLVLVFVVYKMVAPTSAVPPSTDIAPVAEQQPREVRVDRVMNAEAPVTTQAPVQHPPVMEVAPRVEPPVVTAAPVAPPVTAAPVTAVPAPVAQTTPAMQAPIQNMPPPEPTTGTTLPMAQQMPPPATPEQVMAPAQMAATVPQPVAQPAPQPAPMQSGMTQTTTTVVSGPNNPVPTPVDARAAALSNDTTRIMNQMEAEYTQKLSEYAVQNKALQQEVQSLNSRISGMEGQLNQLVQTLIKQNQDNNVGPSPAIPPPAAPQASDPRVSYNVQAIIPGRAWLRSDSGETLTVAEGDVIKDLGRVTKIDPYDGVVEINTGSRSLSLSYGNTG